MTSNLPESGATRSNTNVTSGIRVVISGMSGLYPQAQHVIDLEKILYEKVNPVSNESIRWKYNHPELVQYTGNAPGLDQFDAQFFKVHYRQGQSLDPFGRKLLEKTYEAIYDAGMNPDQLNGKNVGVFIGSSNSETEKTAMYEYGSITGMGLTGCSKTMFANRISYWLNAKGPSMNIDVACCSSTAALEQGYLAISRGDCECAIVGGANLCLSPQYGVHYGRTVKLSTDGKTRSFDQNSTGTAISEAVNVLFLQRAKDALRIYADVVHAKCEFTCKSNTDNGISLGFSRRKENNFHFLNDFYAETGVLPKNIEYVEAFGAADPESDKDELETIDNIFCKHRDEALLVGSVMSNIGYTIASSGIAAVTKVLLGYSKGKLAGNLHYENPRNDVAAVREGRICVLNDHRLFRGTYAAVNSLSLTGANGHVLLRGLCKYKDISRYSTDIPHLVNVSGRQESAVNKIFDELKCNSIDAEQLALLHNIHETKINGHLGRGFIILDNKNSEHKTVSLSEEVDYFDDLTRPLWFVYSGMGSQWAGMGAQLMRIPIFAAAIERCHRALEPKGIDISRIICSPDKSIFDNIVHSFVGIAAIQIGLTDVLKELGLVPHKIIGHSVGELGCAYADGCLTTEEMILSAYSRGRVSTETCFILGSMAAVGMGYNKMAQICPPDIYIACHNSQDSCTISGPAASVLDFIADLTAKGIFAKEVPCSNIAFHSRYINDAGPGLLKYLKEVIKSRKLRSERWVSTSVPREKWEEPMAKFSSAEYHTNNLLSPVLFEETIKLIPANAVLVEVAPHGLLQAILKRALPDSCTNIPLTRRGHKDNALFLLDAIGKLYIKGYNPKIRVLYPKVEFPVSVGTPMLSHFVEWVHDEKWQLFKYISAERRFAAAREFLVSVYESEYTYLEGHVIRDKTILPFSFALIAAWDTLSMSMHMKKYTMDVEFREVRFYTQPVLLERRSNKLRVTLHRGNGRFEIMADGNSRIATGFIKRSDLKNTRGLRDILNMTPETSFALDTKDIYQLFDDRDYSYKGDFRVIESANMNITNANLYWNKNWVTLMDGIIQLNLLKQHYNHSASQLDQIGRITINVKEHQKHSVKYDNGSSYLLSALISDLYNFSRCGGIVIENLKLCNLDIPPAHYSLSLKSLIRADFHSDTKPKISENERIILECKQIGNISSLHWINAPGANMQIDYLIKVQYAGLNVNDVKRASGVITSQNIRGELEIGYGMEFSGLAKSGEKVMGLVRSGAASSLVEVQPELLWPVPSHWTLEDAATVPLAYVFAYYCLDIKVAIRLVEKHITQFSVLVHGAAGALGQAMISVALSRGYKVYATVSDTHKKLFLLRLFPQLHADDIGNSRDANFGDMIINATDGRGCNIVLCCLKNNLKSISLRCCGSSGTTFDTVLINIKEDYSFGMDYLSNERAYIPVDITSVFDMTSQDRKKLQAMVSEGISTGAVRPLSRVTFPPHEAARAFRLLAGSRHRGRVLLRLHDPLPHAIHRVTFAQEKCHLLLCNDQLLGLNVADALINCGSDNIFIHVDKITHYLRYKVRLWKNLNVHVIVSSEIIDSDTSLGKLLYNVPMPLDGVYVIGNNPRNYNVVSGLDSLTRKLYPALKHFLVLSEGYVGLTICTNRAKNGLPATMLNVSELNNVCKSSNWHQIAAEATVQALSSADPILIAQAQPSNSSFPLQPLSALEDVNNTDKTTNEESLESLGMNPENPQSLSVFLSNKYHNSTSEESTHKAPLTDRRFKQMHQVLISENKLNKAVELYKFLSHVDSDELLATTEMVFLPTLMHNYAMRDDDFDMNETSLCIIPGLEGHHARFRSLCERLKLPAFVLQPGLDVPNETPREQANRYAEILIKRTGKRNEFYLLGYEMGVIVALELAAILEDQGMTGTVYCLGSSPSATRALLERELESFGSEGALQEGVVRHMYTLMTRGSAAPVESALRGCHSWSERVDACLRTLRGRVSLSAQYARALLDAAYSRITMALSHRITPRQLRSRLVLLQANCSPQPEHLDHTDLQHYSTQKLQIHDLNTPIPHVVEDLQVPAIINNYLDEKILQAFQTKNLCESYLLKIDSFTSTMQKE